MGKLILMSVLVSSLAQPLLAARDPDPRRGLRRAVLGTAVFNLFYTAAVLYVYPRL